MPKRWPTWASFTIAAPGVVGGGIDKAAGMAAQLDKVDPARAHELRGHICRAAQGLRHTPSGSSSRRSACSDTSGFPVDDAGQLLSPAQSAGRRWSRQCTAEKGCRSGQACGCGALQRGFAAALQSNRDLARAAKMLEEYLGGKDKTEEAPAFVAHTWLAELKTAAWRSGGCQPGTELLRWRWRTSTSRRRI